jgi:RNA ligase
MNFEPPFIESIKDVLPVIQDNPAFVVKDKGWYTVIDYMYMTDKLFHDPIERECRGLKFCSKTGKILARPYHKFHNLGERADYAFDKVDLTRPHVILDKLDGSMVHTCATELGIYLMTRMGITEVAERADAFLLGNQIKYGQLFNALPVEEYTYIFEYVGPSNKIVLDYKREDLILTAIRHNQNGTYLFHDELVKLGRAFKVPVVPVVEPLKYDKDNIDNLGYTVAGLTGSEGVVVRFDTGSMVKIKADEYVRRHRTKDLVSSEKGIIGLIVDNNVDDVLPQLDESVAEQVKAYAATINSLLDDTAGMAQRYCDETKELSQKDFAVEVTAKVAKPFQCVYFRTRKGFDAREELLNVFRRNCSTNKRIGELLDKLMFPRWTFSFFSEE